MLKKLIFTCFIFAAGGFFMSAIQPAEVLAADTAKIGIVDVQKVISKSEKGIAAKNQIMQKADKIRKDLERRQEEIEKAYADLLRQASVMDPAVVNDKRQALERRKRDLEIQLKDFQIDIQNDEAKSLAPIFRGISKVVDEIGKEKGFTLILDPVRSGILFRQESTDITDEVIRRYNLQK